MGTNCPGVCLVGITLSNSHPSANFLIWYWNLQHDLIRQWGIPQTGQGILCRVMEYTFCHFIIIIAKYNKWPNNLNWFKILMPHSFSYAVSMNLEHSIKEGSHERYTDHFQCFRNIIKNKIPWFSGHDNKNYISFTKVHSICLFLKWNLNWNVQHW